MGLRSIDLLTHRRDERMSKQSDLNDMCPVCKKHSMGTWWQSLRTWVADMAARQGENKAAIDELIDDHATFKTVVDELTAWAEALATKMNADTGIADTDYDAVITADAPAALTAGKPTALSAPTPGTLAE
jgi:hypothetical protein